MEAFDLYSPAIDADPFPHYEILREQYPCYWSESGKLWILSRYDDIVRAARDWETFSSSQGNMIDELPGRAGATLGTTDPPRHDRLRALSQAAFLRKNLEHLVAPTLEIAERVARSHLRERELRIHQRLLQPDHRRPPVADHGPARARSRRHQAQGHPRGLDRQVGERPQPRAHRRLQGAERLPHRRSGGAAQANPTDDLITHLAEAEIDGDRLSEREIVLTTATFVMAGVESLSSFMSMFALNLHDYPDARRRIVADAALIAPAIEESLRFNTSAQRFKRTVMRETELHGEKLRIGDKVALAFGSGNRDWRKFPDPDRYDIERRPQGHLGFGAGKHFCLGSQMARLVTEVAMKRFLDRVPEYHLTVDKPAWNSSSNFRSPAALPFATR